MFGVLLAVKAINDDSFSGSSADQIAGVFVEGSEEVGIADLEVDDSGMLGLDGLAGWLEV